MDDNALPLLLRRACAGDTPHLSDRTAAAIAALPATKALAELAFEHRVAPWLAAAIRTRPELHGSAHVEPIVAAAAEQSFGTLSLYAELTRLLGELNAREIPVVVLKGPGIAQTFYPERSLRPYGDIDLLVSETAVPVVADLLLARGYHEKNDTHQEHRLHDCHGLFQRIFIHPIAPHIVEVHADHLQIGLEPVSMSEIWDRAPAVRFGNETARVLELHDLVVQLAVHLHRHGFSRLIWFKDLDLIFRRETIDWAAVREGAIRQGCLASLAHTLTLLRSMLGTPLPPEAEAICREVPWPTRKLQALAWRPKDVLSLAPQDRWRLRRAVQFAPETGLLRGGLPSLLFLGRRREKLSVLGAAFRRRLSQP